MNIGRIASICALLTALCACETDISYDEHVTRANQFIASSNYSSAVIELKNALLKDSQSSEARWLLGKVYFDTGDARSAEKELQRALALGWPPNDVIPILAESLLVQGKYTQVGELAESSLNSQSESRLLAAKAMAAKGLGDIHKAITLANSALEKAPESVPALLAKTRVLVGEGDFAGAALVLEKVIPNEPDNASAWGLMGDIHIGEKKPQDALIAFDNAIALQKNDYPTMFKRALLRLQLEDYRSAQLDATELLRIAPQQSGANYVQGLIHLQTGRHDEAITRLWIAIPDAKRYPLALFFLSCAQLKTGNLDQASVLALRFHKLIPDSIRGRKLLSFIRLKQGRHEDAWDLLGPVLQVYPDDTDALMLTSNAMLRNNRVNEGITFLSRVAAQEPETSIAQIRLGAGRLLSGDSDDAAEYLETSLDLGPEYQQTDILKVMRYTHQQDYEAAIAAAQTYRRRHLVDTLAINLLGRIYQSAGKQDTATKWFAKALKQDTGNPAANQNLAQMAIASEDLATARKHYATILDHNSDNLIALMQLALLDDLEKKEESFVNHLRRAIWAHERAVEPRLLLSRYHLNQGRPQNVAALFENLEETQQQLPQVLQLTALATLAIRERAQDKVESKPPTSGRELIAYWVRKLAPEYGLDPNLIMAIIQAESNFDPGARSHANALGLMQLIPATAARFGVRNRADPVQNLHGGMAYMQWLLSFFDGDLRLSLAGYNAGEGSVVKYLGVPPYPETQNYVRKVVRTYGRNRHPPIEPVVRPTRFMPEIRANQFSRAL